jgi:peptidoglycan/xylan/chitin deacetylase (PgdA/CDA1 family)
MSRLKTGHVMHFCIRDDDTSYFTTPNDLESAYGEITRVGPVSLGVVPFHRAGDSKGVPEKLRGRWTIHPLHENGDLVEYLRENVAKGRFEIMLHGYHHDDPDAQFEFARGALLHDRLSTGRKYLEDILGTRIRVFVPPRNRIARGGLLALAREGLHLGGVAGVRYGWPPLSCQTWRLWSQLRRWQRHGGVGVPWVLDLGDHKEIAGNAVTPSASFLRNKAAYDAALKINGVFCLATHYWEMSAPSKNPNNPNVGDHLRYFVNIARSDPQVFWRSVGDVVTETGTTF